VNGLSAEQLGVAGAASGSKIFLEGPAGCGKTTAGTARLRTLAEAGVPGDQILVWVPQRTLALPYSQTIQDAAFSAGSPPAITTLGGLARRTVDLFWPVAATAVGFAQPERPPIFLNLESAQYHMAQLVRPLLDEGLFESVSIDRNRLYSQILDNLNKAALVGFAFTEIGQRLQSAWVGSAEQLRIYQDVQTCAALFRTYCLEHNLLDYSLTLETFFRHAWKPGLARDYLLAQHRHLIVDNIEEDTPASHDVLADWVQSCESALLIYDSDAGYRSFLGADPENSYTLKDHCNKFISFTTSFVNNPVMTRFQDQLAVVLQGRTLGTPFDASDAFINGYARFYPDLLDWTMDEIVRLVIDQGVSPAEIVVLAPYLSDSLRFSLSERLGRHGIPVQTHRPSRSLRAEPAAQTLITLAAVAHPDWELHADRSEFAYALRQAISDLDLVRAQLLAEILYQAPLLESFEQVPPEIEERITTSLGGRYEDLRRWIERYRKGDAQPLDFFLARLFGEVLAQPGFRFHHDLDSGRVAATLIESVRHFRKSVAPSILDRGGRPDREYMVLVREGMLASQYVRNWQAQESEAVSIVPAYTFLMSNRPVDYQFWLNVNSTGWWERLFQPLTQPHVLSRSWQPGQKWTDQHEVAVNRETLLRLTSGLVRRCRERIYLGISEYDEHGYEHRGELLIAFQELLIGQTRL